MGSRLACCNSKDNLIIEDTRTNSTGTLNSTKSNNRRKCLNKRSNSIMGLTLKEYALMTFDQDYLLNINKNVDFSKIIILDQLGSGHHA